jgi:AbrB family looped-hinge helix DNA binding protein
MKQKVVQITTTSPKGQVVIPQEIREEMSIETGTKFAVYGRKDTLIFKKIDLPTVKDFERLVTFGRAFAKKKEIQEKDVLALSKKIDDGVAKKLLLK